MGFLKRRHEWLVSYLAVTDYLAIVGSFAVIVRLRFRPHIDIIDISELRLIPQVSFVFFYGLIMLAGFAALGLYKRKVWLSPMWHSFQIAKGALLGFMGYVIMQYLSKSPIFLEYRSVTFSWGLLLFILLVFHRIVVLRLLRMAIFRSDWRRRVVVLGASEMGREFAQRCASGDDYESLRIVGFFDDEVEKDCLVAGELKCLGRIATLRDNVEFYGIEGAVVTASKLSYQEMMDITEECVRLFGWVDIHCDNALCLQANLDVDTYFEIPFVRMGDIPNGFSVRVYKRITDIVMALSGIVLFSPLLLAVAIYIKLVSRGPVFYVSDRVGHKGGRFRFLKFRSMKEGADSDEERRKAAEQYVSGASPDLPSKVVNEAYLIPGGHLLRRFAIDELPQLINVLRGEMSIVGPRPSPVDEYEMNDEWQKKRFDIKPGCTGLWKLCTVAHKNASFNSSVFHDIYYARNMNPLLDLYIILGTIRIIAGGNADS